MNYIRIKQFLCLACSFLILFSCNQGKNGTIETDTATTGSIKISVDETFRPIIEAELNTFHSHYKYASVSASYKPESEAIFDVLNDSCRLAIVPRTLTKEEEKFFERDKITPRITKIAIDAIALIVHNSNTDTTISVEELKQIFTGKISNWKQLNSKSNLGDITVVFDNKNSSTVRYVLDSLTNHSPLPSNSFAATSNPALIEYVSQNKNAIGVIGVNWISDRDDSTAMSFLKSVKVVATGHESTPREDFVQPYQAYIAQKTYPLTRSLYIISREARMGLGTGFVSFVAGDKGQRIILKSGLLPATMPVRIVGFR